MGPSFSSSGFKRTLRSATPRDVPPGWELTADAAAYRKQWMERQQWMLDQFHHHKEDAEDDIDLPDTAAVGDLFARSRSGTVYLLDDATSASFLTPGDQPGMS